VDTKEELLQQISDSARHITNAIVLCKDTYSLENEPVSASKLSANILNNYFKAWKLYNIFILSLSKYKCEVNLYLKYP
jgi:hypothetical protein